MKSRLSVIAVVLAGLLLAGCGSTSIFKGGSSITATVKNPATNQEMAALYAAYGVAASAAVNYRRFCYSTTLDKLPSICENRRSIVLQMQTYDRKANAALKAARNFIRNNPEISAVTALAAAREAISDYQNFATAQANAAR